MMTDRTLEVDTHLLRSWPLKPSGGGTALVVGGSRQSPGGVMLAAEAALRTGAVKVQVVTVESVARLVAVALPEAYVAGAGETEAGELDVMAADVILELAAAADAVLLGPGMMDPETGGTLVRGLLPRLSCPVALDALALSCLADGPQVLAHLRGQCVLTPNEGEIALALGRPDDALPASVLEAARMLVEATGVVVTSGSGVTWTAAPDGRSWRDASGVPGLATAGSGDVKSGLVVGLLSRGAAPEQATVWATHLHGLAGERVAAATGPVGFLARQLLPHVPELLDGFAHDHGAPHAFGTR